MSIVRLTMLQHRILATLERAERPVSLGGLALVVGVSGDQARRELRRLRAHGLVESSAVEADGWQMWSTREKESATTSS